MYRATQVRTRPHDPGKTQSRTHHRRTRTDRRPSGKANAQGTQGDRRAKGLDPGDLLEGIVLHVFEGKTPFGERTLKEIEQFASLYGMTLRASDSHNLKERKK